MYDTVKYIYSKVSTSVSVYCDTGLTLGPNKKQIWFHLKKNAPLCKQALEWKNEWMNECVSCVMASQCSWMAGRSHWRNRGVCKGSCAWATPWCCYCGSASDAPASASSPEPCWVEMSPAAAHMTHTRTVSIHVYCCGNYSKQCKLRYHI